LTECEEDVVSHYTAISYVWGDPMDTRTIMIDGKTLEITATLDWADAICIYLDRC
jgi:hypothetical protein